ncbi:spore coat protein CotJB [Hydrogenoanaerobacterium sp.]|uniref:spore coat protein CotJB n=1 Tax=Hydrogenoanaerobacterium sp. TaxID=2953763 RepID=UPI002899BB2A|nr:spore coat protein CotJB [Hydrogenoanaerobacterium sp.]
MSNEQKVLANRIKVCDLILVETGLFLDTHPTDKDALAFFKKYNDLYTQAKNEYIEKYGPIMQTDYNGGDRWNWIDSPWPWEHEEDN